MQDLKTIDLDTLASVTGGSTSGQVCRAGSSAGGGRIVVVLTSGTFAWVPLHCAVLPGPC